MRPRNPPAEAENNAWTARGRRAEDAELKADGWNTEVDEGGGPSTSQNGRQQIVFKGTLENQVMWSVVLVGGAFGREGVGLLNLYQVFGKKPYMHLERERDIPKKWIDLEVEHVYQSSIQLWDVPGSWIVFLKEHFESIQRERQRKRGKE